MHFIINKIGAFRQRLWDHPVHWWTVIYRMSIVAIMLAAIIALGWAWGEHIPGVEAFIARLGLWGPVIFIVLFIVLMPFFVPNAPLAMVAGALFGLVWGTVYIVIAGFIAELIIFAVGHRYLRAKVEKALVKHPKLLALRSALTKKPLRLMILLRLSPIPFTPICYMLSTTRVSYRDYIIGFIGYIPGNFVTVYFGFVAKHVAKLAGGTGDFSLSKIILAIVALVVTMMLITYVSHAAKKALEAASPSISSGPSGSPR